MTVTFPLSSARTGRAFSIVLTDDVLRDLLRSHHGCKIGARRHDGWKDRCVGDPETFHANHSAAIVDDGIGVLRRTQPAGPDGMGRERHRTNKVRPSFVVRGKRSEEHTSELQSLMRISYAVFCLKKKSITCNTTAYYYAVHDQ